MADRPGGDGKLRVSPEPTEELGPDSSVPRDDFARGVAHAINNPLAALVANLAGVLELLRDEPRDPEARIAEALLCFEEMELAAERIQAVVQKLQAAAAPSFLPPPNTLLPPSALVEAPAGVSRRARVLLVDDDEMVRTALCRSLRDFDVVGAESGQAALDHLMAGESFDVVLCDLMMPEMTGMDLYDAVLGGWPGLADRMVFFTGGAITTRARDFVASMPARVLSKPVDLETLRSIVRSRAPGFLR